MIPYRLILLSAFLSCNPVASVQSIAAEILEVPEDIPVARRAPFTPAEKIRQKLDTIVIPRLDLKETPLNEAVALLTAEGYRLDEGENRGISVAVRLQPAAGANVEPMPAITLSAKNIPLGEALKCMADLSNLECVVDDNGIVLAPPAKKAKLVKVGRHDPAGNKIQNRLDAIIIPKVDFFDTSLPDALQFLQEESARLGPDPKQNGGSINFVLDADGRKTTKVNLVLENAALGDVLDILAAVCGLRYVIQDNEVKFVAED